MDGLAKLIAALAQVLKAVAWPSLVGFAVWHFRSSIRTFLDNIGEASLKLPGFEASAKRREAVVAVATAQIAKSEKSPDPQMLARPEQVAASLATADTIVTRGALRDLASKRILWVDDHPDNNLWERNALEAMGARVTTVTSTESALEALKGLGGAFDLIISDMTRGSDKMAGYDLLKEIRSRSIFTPYIIYAGSASPDQQIDALQRGATGRANDPEHLIKLVVRTLSRSA